MPETITLEEKIDYIYTRLKKQERSEKINFILKWLFRIFILGYLYYFLMFSLPNMIDALIPSIPNIHTENFSEKIPEGKMQEFFESYFSK